MLWALVGPYKQRVGVGIVLQAAPCLLCVQAAAKRFRPVSVVLQSGLLILVWDIGCKLIKLVNGHIGFLLKGLLAVHKEF